MIKKHRNKNEYLLTENGLWVRNFTKSLVPYVNINKTIEEKDYFIFLNNEYNNTRERYSWIDTESFYHPKILIVSDGYQFNEKHKLLANLPTDVAIIGVHGSLAKWQLPKNMTYYLVNNPYKECMRYLPKKNGSLPKCIASTRTNHEFLRAYRGSKYRYVPVSEEKYNGMEHKEIQYQIDDYRNPICAAISLAYQFGVEKLALFCCDDSFQHERQGAEHIRDDLWMYAPQKLAHELIDGSFYWLKTLEHTKIQLADCSSGPVYKNAEYIAEEKLQSFFSTEYK